MQVAEDFDAFVAIVDAGSISAAARALGVPRATLSRQLARLEDRLGVRLLTRTTRALVSTPAGEALYPRARRLLAAATEAVDVVQRLDDVPRGRLRVSCAPAQMPLLGMLIGEFIQAFPEVQVEVETGTRFVDLITEQVDVALRGGVVREPNLIARRLLSTDLLAVASPAYLERAGTPMRPVDLRAHACLQGFQAGARPATAWPLSGGGKIRVDGPLVSNDLMVLLGATLTGLGVALLPRALVATRVAEGALVPVLDGQVGIEVSLSLVWVERALLDAKVRAFIDMAVQWSEAGRLGQIF
ncbi:MAG: DNA-binding transcriptional LysR family regulator [Bradymonadia bacterium]|jgi:DNA-binding transcriptional LysR family regulator